MTTHKTYNCNLCNDSVKPSDGTSREGFGVHFNGYTPRPDLVGGWFNFKRVSEAERHICLACAVAVRDELSKVTPAVIVDQAGMAGAGSSEAKP